MARLRFVHAADLHLDSPFRGIRSEAPDHVAQTLSSATFDAYQNIINLCIQARLYAKFRGSNGCDHVGTPPLVAGVGGFFTIHGKR